MSKKNESIYDKNPSCVGADNNRYAIPILSKKDEDVPDNVYPLYDLFIVSPDVRNLYGEEKANKLRRDTFKNVLNEYKRIGTRDYATFWNYNVTEITRLGFNEFAKFEPLKDLCNYIQCFQKAVTVKGVVNKRISFGIKKEYLQRYVKAKQDAFEKGIEFVPPVIPLIRRAGRSDLINYGEAKLLLTGETDSKVEVAKNCIFKRFEHCRILNGMKRTDAFMLAMKDFAEKYKVEGLHDLKDYHVETVFNEEFIVKNNAGYKEKPIQVLIDGKEHERMQRILAAFNSDVENKWQPDKTMVHYTREAIKLMNDSMPLKYSDPEQYQELMELQKLAESEEFINGHVETSEE